MNPINKISDTKTSQKVLHKNGNYIVEKELIISKLNRIITQCISFSLQIEPDKISSESNFYGLGIDSLRAVEIIGELEDKLNLPISANLMFEYSTITELSTYFTENYSIRLKNEILVIQDKEIPSELIFGVEPKIKSEKESQPIIQNQRITGEL